MVVLVDGNNVLYCNTAASKLTSKGRPTQGIFGTLKELNSIMIKYKPEAIMVMWDGSRSRRRMEIFPEYKGDRADKTPEEQVLFEEFLLQKPIVRQAILDLGLYSVEGKHSEADDVIAWVTRWFVGQGKQVVIVSSDKDFFQLINSNVRIFKPTQKEPREITESVLIDLWGVRPEQWLDLRAVVGDASDNIKGVKGVAEKTMGSLLKKHGSLSEFFCKGIGSGRREQLLLTSEAKDVIVRNKVLMDLVHPCVYEDDLEAVDFKKGELNQQAFRDMAIEYEMKSIFMIFKEWIRPFVDLYQAPLV